MGHWRFDSDTVRGRLARDLTGVFDGRIQGSVTLTALPAALRFDGQTNSVLLAENPNPAKLPRQSMTVAAWVAVDKPIEWGGLIGAIQDNGDYERGWLLGNRRARFTFALASAKTNKLTYLASQTEFKTGQWYHVVGVYDGQTQSVYVNGRLENTSTAQRGPIAYPEKMFLEIGAYHDDNENYRFQGTLHDVRLYNTAASAEQIALWYQRQKLAFPQPLELALGPIVARSLPARWKCRG